MSTPDDLEREAYSHLDECRFAEAREAYRRVALAKTPTVAMLCNLGVAEERERLAFARVIAERYPENMKCRLHEATTMLVCHVPNWAVLLCTDLLQLAKSPKEEMEVRCWRFRAAARCRDRYSEFLEDFTAIWRMGDQYDWARLGRGMLLEEVAALTNRESLPMLEELDRGQWNSTGVAELIRTKIAELRLLADAIEELGMRKLKKKLAREREERRQHGQGYKGDA